MTTAVAILSSAAGTTAAPPSTLFLRRTSAALPPPSSVSFIRASRVRSRLTCCEVAVKSESSVSIGGDSSEEEDELKRKLEVVGSRVRVTTPLKLYHIPKVPEVELKPGTEGVIKQYVGFWKGKRISANLPYKVEFQIEIEGRGPVKFFAHLKEDEFEFVERSRATD
ncbi:hypothetical protein Cgig2_013564 [Carnegiea gigantea]|uniref:Ferredoxin thioredoxin reductase alpha chain domain-containing protein n=1 Tax=Carnegiea gigantea TaxID=171969 RepID=A0A9Q1GIH1_9CARY|nr:hypothetical protein Cgig2_013564 [Carnegiea gigantea]